MIYLAAIKEPIERKKIEKLKNISLSNILDENNYTILEYSGYSFLARIDDDQQILEIKIGERFIQPNQKNVLEKTFLTLLYEILKGSKNRIYAYDDHQKLGFYDEKDLKKFIKNDIQLNKFEYINLASV